MRLRASAASQKADLRVSMSAFPPISSASPPGADFPGGVAEGLLLTQNGHKLSRQFALPTSAQMQTDDSPERSEKPQDLLLQPEPSVGVGALALRPVGLSLGCKALVFSV